MPSSAPRLSFAAGITLDVLLVLFTGALAWVAYLQWGTLDRQAEIQEAQTKIQGLLSRPTIAPAYVGKRTDGAFIIKLTNTGATPARGVRIARVSDTLSNPRQQQLEALCGSASPGNDALTVHAHGSIEHHVSTPSRAPNTTQSFFICGYILYSDGDRSSYREPFCFSLDDKQFKSTNDHTICPLSEQGT